MVTGILVEGDIAISGINPSSDQYVLVSYVFCLFREIIIILVK